MTPQHDHGRGSGDGDGGNGGGSPAVLDLCVRVSAIRGMYLIYRATFSKTM